MWSSTVLCTSQSVFPLFFLISEYIYICIQRYKNIRNCYFYLFTINWWFASLLCLVIEFFLYHFVTHTVSSSPFVALDSTCLSFVVSEVCLQCSNQFILQYFDHYLIPFWHLSVRWHSHVHSCSVEMTKLLRCAHLQTCCCPQFIMRMHSVYC